MKYNGHIEKELGGKKRGFQFGMGAFFILSEEWGDEIGKIESKVSEIAQKETPESNDLLLMLKYNRLLVYAGMKNYDLINDNKVDYNFYKASAWMDDMEVEDFTEIVEFANSTKVMGKQKAEAVAETSES